MKNFAGNAYPTKANLATVLREGSEKRLERKKANIEDKFLMRNMYEYIYLDIMLLKV